MGSKKMQKKLFFHSFVVLKQLSQDEPKRSFQMEDTPPGFFALTQLP